MEARGLKKIEKNGEENKKGTKIYLHICVSFPSLVSYNLQKHMIKLMSSYFPER